MTTLRDLIHDELNDIHRNFGTMDADSCALAAARLSSLLSSILEKEADLEVECARMKVAEMSHEDMTVAKANTIVQSSPPYLEYLKVKAIRKGVEETIRSLRTRVKVKINEYQQTV